MVLQQNERFSDIEEKYRLLHGKASSLFDMEEEVLKVSKKVRLICRMGTAVFFGGWNFLKGPFTQITNTMKAQ